MDAKKEEWEVLCKKVRENPESFEFVEANKVQKFHEDIRELDEKTTEAYANAKNYYVRLTVV